MASSKGLAFVSVCAWSASAFASQVNIYGKPMTDCGQNHAAGCAYAAYDAGAHQVCVTQLPKGFSTVTGQGPWSDEFTGQPWCICIWAYSNYILQNKDLALKCESIPSKVLEEQYSLDKFAQCGSMSSKEGCGAEDIRRSIQSLCQQCDAQAIDQPSKAALKAKCDKILAAAPAAPMQRLFAQDGAQISKTTASKFAPTAALFCFVLAGLLTGVAVFTARYRRNHAVQGLPDSENFIISAQAVE